MGICARKSCATGLRGLAIQGEIERLCSPRTAHNSMPRGACRHRQRRLPLVHSPPLRCPPWGRVPAPHRPLPTAPPLSPNISAFVGPPCFWSAFSQLSTNNCAAHLRPRPSLAKPPRRRRTGQVAAGKWAGSRLSTLPRSCVPGLSILAAIALHCAPAANYRRAVQAYGGLALSGESVRPVPPSCGPAPTIPQPSPFLNAQPDCFLHP